MFHTELHPGDINLDVAADGGNQVVSKRFKFGRGQIRTVMDKDKLQAFLGAVGAVLFSKKFIQE